MSRRKFPATKNLHRNAETRSAKYKIIIVCEGKNTEPKYLESFKSQYGNNLVVLDLIEAAGAPVTIVERAISAQRDQKKIAKKSSNSFDNLFEVWGVFDVDNHPNIPEAKIKATSNKIKLAITNPCFELWPYLHYRYHAAPIDPIGIQRLLESEMPDYNRRTNKIINYADIQDQYCFARDNAIRLNRDQSSCDSEGGNPSTNIHELLDKIVQNGKRKVC